MTGLLRWAWILELVVFFLLMLVFGALVRFGPDQSPGGASVLLSGCIAVLSIWTVLSLRSLKGRARRARPAAIAAVEALDLSSDESRRAFLAHATPYARAHLDTVGDRIWRLIEALRWSSPDRRDYSSLEPLLVDARRCVAIERRARDSLARWLEMSRHHRPKGLTSVEHWILTAGILLGAAEFWVLSPDHGHPEPIFRGMLLVLGTLAVPLLLARWASRRLQPLERQLSAELRRRGLDHDPLAVQVVFEMLGREQSLGE